MVTVYLEYSHSSPNTPKSGTAESMSPSPPTQPTSVFKALGSYADRIREQEAKSLDSSSPTSTQSVPMSATASASGSSKSKISAPTTPAEPNGVKVQVDDGPWETVQSAKIKSNSKHDKDSRERDADKGSNSRNWRDRPQREKTGESSRDAQAGGDKKASGGVAGTKGKKGSAAPATPASGPSNTASVSAPPTRTSKAQGTNGSTSSRAQPSSSIAAPAKPAWGLPAAPVAKAPATTAPVAESSTNTKSNSSTNASTAPTSPTTNGTAPAHSNDESPADSPGLSTPAAPVLTHPSTSTPDEQGNNKAPKAKNEIKEQPAPAESSAPAPKAAATPKIAPPPVTNPWARKLGLASPAVIFDSSAPTPNESKPSARLQFGELSPTVEAANPLPSGMANGHSEEPVKIGGKKKKKDTALVMDVNQWPDVAQAQAVGVKEPKKEVKPVEEAAEEATTGKKPKWKPIPAKELLAAVDEATLAAEAKQRSQRKRGTGAKHGESSTSTSPINKTASLSGKARKNEGKRGEMRIPPNPNGQTPRTAFKPTFGSVEPGSEGDAVSNHGDVYANGHASAPLSRQTSRASKMASSPRAGTAGLPSSTSDSAISLENTIRLGAGPLKGQTQHATAPLPQQPFPMGAPGNLPRPPRGGRASFSGRGRGGGRGGRGGFVHDPNMAFGPGYYGQPGFAGVQPMFDPMQAQWYNMQMYGRAPPPTPHTVVPHLNLDHLRFGILGQVEYYFSMQNLAMDFFLRQQMDTEGWISIAMIASFNRIKTYSADVALVKEMMEVSSLLEVQGDHVRIAGDQAKKWVLPDAKPSPFPPSEFTPTPATTAAASVSDTLDTEENDSTAVSDCLSINGNPENAFDMKDMGFGTDVKYQPDEVKAALMKSGSSAGAAAAAPSKLEEDKVDEGAKVNGDAEAR